MSKRSILLIVAAALLVASTFFLARNWMDNQRVQVAGAYLSVDSIRPEPVEPTYVLVAARNLPAGSFVKENDLSWQAWPEASIADSYFVKDKVAAEDLYGAVVRRGLNVGEPVITTGVVRSGDRGFLAAVLGPGYRAVATSVNAASGIAGLIFPGDRVDIILTHTIKHTEDGERRARTASETVLTNVRILALDQTIDDQGTEAKVAKTVTFELLPKQVEILAVVRELGSLSLSLRSLAKDDAELERLALGSAHPLDDPVPAIGRTFTLDSEASRLAAAPRKAGKKASGTVIRIVRGLEAKEQRL